MVVAALALEGIAWIVMKRRRDVRSDTRGAATVEYVVLVGAVGLGVMVALVAIGPVLIGSYQQTRSIVASPFP